MSAKEFTIKKGETIDLGGEAKVKFVAHTHRRTKPEQGPSPLVIQLEYFENDQSESATYNFYVKDFSPELEIVPSVKRNTGWKWHNYIFELVRHVYDESMDLRVTYDPNSKEDDGLLSVKPE